MLAWERRSITWYPNYEYIDSKLVSYDQDYYGSIQINPSKTNNSIDGDDSCKFVTLIVVQGV